MKIGSSNIRQFSERLKNMDSDTILAWCFELFMFSGLVYWMLGINYWVHSDALPHVMTTIIAIPIWIIVNHTLISKHISHFTLLLIELFALMVFVLREVALEQWLIYR